MSESTIRALVVEDNAQHGQLLRSLLESSPSPVFSVFVVDTMAKAIATLREDRIDIVLLDLTLPDSQGIDTFEKIFAAAPDLPIVVLSGQADVALAIQTVQLGAQDYLLKGHVDNQLLIRSIQYGLERKRSQVELKRAYESLEQRVRERTAALRDSNAALQREIDERKRAEAQSLDSNRQLVEALTELRSMQQALVQRERLRALAHMANGIAHEFNNVLTPVLGYAEHLLSHPDVIADPERSREYIQRIADAARTGTKAVGRVRDLARTESGGSGPASLEDIVQSSVTMTEPRWRNEALMAGKTVIVSQRVEEVPDVIGEPGQLREMLMQLIFNAVSAIERRGMVSISAATRGDRVALSVADDGRGMPDGVRMRLLDPKQCTPSKSGGVSGFGVVHGVVSRHGATLEIESVEGQGTKITIVLPAVHAEEKPAPASPPEPSSRAKSLRILVADDEPMVREIICIYLGEDGHSTEVAENGADALELFCREDFDLVLTDRAMPELNGDQLALEIKKRKPSVPVVLLTGFGDMMNSEGELPEGVDAVVAKPFTMATLHDALAKYTGPVPGTR